MTIYRATYLPTYLLLPQYYSTYVGTLPTYLLHYIVCLSRIIAPPVIYFCLGWPRGWDTFSYTITRLPVTRSKVGDTFPGSAELRGVGYYVTRATKRGPTSYIIPLALPPPPTKSSVICYPLPFSAADGISIIYCGCETSLIAI